MAVEFGRALPHILIALAFHSTICVCSSISYQDTDNNYKVNSNKHNSSLLPCYTRYILESYFREYESCSDSNFQEYMVHKNPFGSERTFGRLWNFERRLIGEGSHRRLSSFIRFSIHQDWIADISFQTCEVILIEKLPLGVFADPFELEHLLQRGVLRDGFVFGDANLELPSFLSNQSIVEVHLEAAFDELAQKEIVKELNVEIPIHARYSHHEESGYSKVRFGVADLFLRCKKQGESAAESCVLKPMGSSVSLKDDEIVWSIPAGMKAHSSIVSAVTFTSALLSAVGIIVTSFRSNPN
ncbi:unnamed protein product [Cuscuta epithymum]|uniref:Phosphatidylinositol-glycan biosynthesis class X protein n=1 Tax=Cuscuta epithymum TaxID=186058 RepID=A0AAV0DEK0_9ASTE|nr:unnamed protein product [Cuscuta epithymum]